MNIGILLPAFVAALIAFGLTPFVIKLVTKYGAIDVPNDDRRAHTIPIPTAGGIGMFISFFITFFMFANIGNQRAIGLFIGSLLILIAGLVDDLHVLSAKKKLVFQIAAAIILYFSGYQITFLNNFFGGSDNYIFLELFSFPVTIMWIVGITNTVNIIDGLDGLAAGISTISAVTLGVVALNNSSPEYAMIMFILAGSCIGFLPYNFNPARIFMGDTGAMFLGFILAAMSIQGTLKSATAIAVVIPILALGVPILDTFSAIVRRIRKKKSIAEADKEHMHHKLIFIGYNQKKAVLTMYSISALLGISAIFLVNGQIISCILVALVAVVFILLPLKFRYNKES